ncbi:MAG: DNA-3-methyladenine glycosylase [Bacteroidales bacterium]
MKKVNPSRLGKDFFTRDVLEVAPGLPGKIIVTRSGSGSFARYQITEVEAYRGSEDRACHASRGRTRRTEIMYHAGGISIYTLSMACTGCSILLPAGRMIPRQF